MAKRKQTQPSQTSIRKVLSESAFDPRVPGPLKVIADTGNVEYLVTRAIEFLREGQYGADATRPMDRDKLTQAISLLALAKVKLGG